ncbi:PRP40 pre-mRNA processing factor 40 [Cadophora gregata]|uniref:PRP40 pre-mRNA processing factor 40 n=1 Tax=Cadophora gregata TaxID=51156 RepID=UPI0026DC673E|nr:PRP40 pre-mRNA processing factor 40 [Cadophora gregata]KAK0104630.1 PRP40 pre-mRNA processing factor 40 [Cadophora gregata]KAK0115282.1 PRP40 pre-mRNA processing factor 40 [Cadophora gregata f. sp. sojae]
MNVTNGLNGHAVAPVLWSEARNAEGRVYYYNTITKATQWTKPEELMTPAERALANQPWKEYTAEGGRKYWYNTETKQSSWEMPDVYKEALSKEAAVPTPVAPAPTFVAGGGFSAAQFDSPRDREPLGEARQIAYGNDVNGSRAQVFVPANTDPDYSTFEEAEAAFLKLLRRQNVDPNWTWEQTMRSIIKDPQYRALKDPKDRKTAFEKYAVEVRAQEKDRAKERIEKLRKDFATMLRSHPEIKHYTRWKTARPIIEAETIFRSAKDDDERRQLFEDYIIELKKANVEREATSRRAAMDELVDILKQLDLEPYTRWSEAQGIIQSNSRFQGDQKLKSLTKSDMLTAFENHIKSLEKAFNDARQQEKNMKSRRERQNRDRFLALLHELKNSNKIKAGSKWSQIHPLIAQDDRYQAILGQPGSKPIDLFWDMVEEEERALRSTRNDVLDVLDDKRFEIQTKTTFEEFLALMQNDRRTANIDRDALSLIFERLHEKVSRRTEADNVQLERQQRRAVDALRSFIKHLEPPIRIDDTFERIRPRVERSEEYVALPSDELRRSAFDKVIRRLKEKEEDAERDRLKRRDRTSVDRPTHRDRDRGERSHRRRTRSPEPDAYEADRRKAIADREKNYRKTSAADTLLSPGRRDRGERDRDRERDRDFDRDLDRPHRSRREEASSHYDRERRDRESEREKLYRKRGDPRGSIDELPYGDERPSANRRRRADSDVESADSARVAKRSRREITPRERTPIPPRERRHRTRTPPAPIPVKEEPAVHSGSEEGEIEEE